MGAAADPGCFVAFHSRTDVSNIGTWMQTVGAQWFWSKDTPVQRSSLWWQTASLKPTLMLALFAGALADRVDRRWLLIAVQAYGGCRHRRC